MQNKIAGVFAITGHEISEVEGFGKISDVAKGYRAGAGHDSAIGKQRRITNQAVNVGIKTTTK